MLLLSLLLLLPSSSLLLLLLSVAVVVVVVLLCLLSWLSLIKFMQTAQSHRSRVRARTQPGPGGP